MRVPFEAYGGGVRAHGTVRSVRQNEDGSHDIGIRHRPLKGKPKNTNSASPMIDDYTPDTNVTVPGGTEHHFPVGKKVTVHITPHSGSSGKRESKIEQAYERRKK